jgi:hypothetical protein
LRAIARYGKKVAGHAEPALSERTGSIIGSLSIEISRSPMSAYRIGQMQQDSWEMFNLLQR